jgi:protein-disulfide isomerase
MTAHIRLLAIAVMTLCLVSPVLAQSPSEQAIQQELARLREAQQAIAKDVEAIRTMLQQAMGPRPAPAAAAGAAMPAAGVQPMTIAGRPSKGSPRARVTVVEYSDYECPYCGQYVAQVYPQIDRDYIKTNKIQYVFKNLPIEQLHRQSFKAHVAAACAGDQQRYWDMHDRLFADQRNLSLDRFVELASMLNLDPVAFRACVESTKHEAMIREDINEARSGGVGGTPVFVLAYTDPKGQTITPARVIVGAQPFEAFKEAIDALLAQANSNANASR